MAISSCPGAPECSASRTLCALMRRTVSRVTRNSILEEMPSCYDTRLHDTSTFLENSLQIRGGSCHPVCQRGIEDSVFALPFNYHLHRFGFDTPGGRMLMSLQTYSQDASLSHSGSGEPLLRYGTRDCRYARLISIKSRQAQGLINRTLAALDLTSQNEPERVVGLLRTQ